MSSFPPQAGARRVSHQGFTLIELVLAAALVGLVIAAGAGFVTQISNARERLRVQTETRAESDAAVRALGAALDALARHLDEKKAKDTAFVGVDDTLDGRPADRLRFFMTDHRVIRAGEPESDVREVEFYLQATEGEALPALMRRTDPTRNAQPDGGGVVELIARRVVGFDVEYFDGERWSMDWPEFYQRPPTALRLRLAVAPPLDEERLDSAEVSIQQAVTVRRLVHFPHMPGGTSNTLGTVGGGP